MTTIKLHPKLAKWQALTEKRVNLQEMIVKPSFRQEHITTGSTVLNMLCGGSRLSDGSFVCPGWPKKSIIEIFGRESSGKTTIALMAMGNALAQNDDQGTGLYVDLEHAVKDKYSAQLGCDFRSVETGGSGRAVRVAPQTFEDVEAIVDSACLVGIDLVVIDSVAGFVSRREAKRDTANEKEKQGIAEIPRLMSQWMPKLQAIIAKTGTCVIFLNQTRDKIGAIGYTEEAKKSTVGGNALKFWAAMRVMLKPKQSAKAKRWNPVLKDFEEVPVATDVEVKMIKNKVDARQGHAGLITIRYGVGIDELRTMLNVAVAYKIVAVTKNAKKQEIFVYRSPSKGTVIEAIGIEKFRMALNQSQHRDEYVEFIQACQARIIEGFKSIDDAELAELAENSITVSHEDNEEDDLEYMSNEAPGEKNDLVDYEGEDGILGSEDTGPSIDASTLLWTSSSQ